MPSNSLFQLSISWPHLGEQSLQENYNDKSLQSDGTAAFLHTGNLYQAHGDAVTGSLLH